MRFEYCITYSDLERKTTKEYALTPKQVGEIVCRILSEGAFVESIRKI